MELVGGRLGRQEKATRGNLWEWIKSKTERRELVLHWWVQDGYIYSALRGCAGEQGNSEGLWSLV